MWPHCLFDLGVLHVETLCELNHLPFHDVLLDIHDLVPILKVSKVVLEVLDLTDPTSQRQRRSNMELVEFLLKLWIGVKML